MNRAMRIAVVGDIHANALALAAALDCVDRSGTDLLVFLGDLLTYGADVEQTLDLVLERLQQGNAVLLRGNHDALYEGLLGSGSEYAGRLPEWIRESADWTLRRLPQQRWRQLAFTDEHRVGEVLFAHANPFGPGDWRYLNTEAEHAQAAEALRSRGLQAGVFGHSHRTKWYESHPQGSGFREPGTGSLRAGAVSVLNAGAVGQPRDASSLRAHVLWLRPSGSGTTEVEFEPLEYDQAAHLARLQGTGLSAGTLMRLGQFFVPGAR